MSVVLLCHSTKIHCNGCPAKCRLAKHLSGVWRSAECHSATCCSVVLLKSVILMVVFLLNVLELEIAQFITSYPSYTRASWFE
jgi:hypothetical protein